MIVEFKKKILLILAAYTAYFCLVKFVVLYHQLHRQMHLLDCYKLFSLYHATFYTLCKELQTNFANFPRSFLFQHGIHLRGLSVNEKLASLKGYVSEFSEEKTEHKQA